MKKGVFKNRKAYKSSLVINNKVKTYCYIGTFTSINKAHSAHLQLRDLVSFGLNPHDAVKLLDNNFKNPINFIQKRFDQVDLENTTETIFLSTHQGKDPAQIISIEIVHLDLLIKSLINIKNNLV